MLGVRALFVLCGATALGAASCSGSGSGVGSGADGAPTDGGVDSAPQLMSVSVKGTVDGGSVDARNVLSVVRTTPTGAGGTSSGVELLITSAPDYCALFSASQSRANITSLILAVSIDGTKAPGPGVYAVPGAAGGPSPVGVYLKVDGSCNATSNFSAKSGTITLEAVSTTWVSGSFALTFDTGTLTGTFSAPSCASPSSSGTVACVP